MMLGEGAGSVVDSDVRHIHSTDPESSVDHWTIILSRWVTVSGYLLELFQRWGFPSYRTSWRIWGRVFLTPKSDLLAIMADCLCLPTTLMPGKDHFSKLSDWERTPISSSFSSSTTLPKLAEIIGSSLFVLDFFFFSLDIVFLSLSKDICQMFPCLVRLCSLLLISMCGVTVEVRRLDHLFYVIKPCILDQSRSLPL